MKGLFLVLAILVGIPATMLVALGVFMSLYANDAALLIYGGPALAVALICGFCYAALNRLDKIRAALLPPAPTAATPTPIKPRFPDGHCEGCGVPLGKMHAPDCPITHPAKAA
jgi:hypothetical protein